MYVRTIDTLTCTLKYILLETHLCITDKKHILQKKPQKFISVDIETHLYVAKKIRRYM